MNLLKTSIFILSVNASLCSVKDSIADISIKSGAVKKKLFKNGTNFIFKIDNHPTENT